MPAPATACAAPASTAVGARPVATAPAAPEITPPISQNAPGRRRAQRASATDAATIPAPKAAESIPYSIPSPCRDRLTRNTSATLSIDANATNRNVPAASPRTSGACAA